MAIDLGSAVAYLNLDTTGFDSGIARASTGAGKFAGVGKVLGIGLAAAATAVVGGLVSIGKQSIDTGAQFDKSMAQVAATMGVTVSEVQELRDYAMDMGAKTAFSASQAADALNYMALAGYDASTSMKMLPNVLNLAAAGGIELATASDMVTDAQSALGLSLEETTVMVDQMAQTSSKSNTSVAQLGDAILTIGATARSIKGGTTELNTLLGVLADNGIKGAEGGTKLRNMLLSLQNPTDEGAAALEKLGVSVYDANGNMRSMIDIINDMKDGIGGMDQASRDAIISGLFNKQDVAAVNALLNTSAERFDELYKSVDNAAGAAQKMADTQLDNLQGDVTLLQSAWEGMKITISDRLTPALRTFVQFGTKELGKLDRAFQEGGISGLANQFGESLSATVAKISEYAPKVLSAGTKFVTSFVTSVVKSLPSIAKKLSKELPKLLSQLLNDINNSLPELIENLGKTLGSLLGSAPEIITAGAKLIGGLALGVLRAIPNLVRGIINGFDDAMTGSERVVSDHVQNIRDSFAEIPDALETVDEKLADINAKQMEADHWIDIFDRLSGKVNPTAEEMNELQTAVDKLNELFPDLDLYIDENTGKWSLNTQEIRNNVKALQDKARAEAYQETATEMYKEVAALELLLEKERQHKAEAGETYFALQKEQGGLIDLRDSLSDLYDQYNRGEISSAQLRESLAKLVPDVALEDASDLAQYLDLLQKKINALENPLEQAKNDFDDASAGVQEYEREIDSLLGRIDLLYEQGSKQTKEAVNDMSDSFESGVPRAKMAGSKTGIVYVDEITGEIIGAKPKVSAAAQELVRSALTVFDKGFSSGLNSSLSRGRSVASYATGLDYVPRTMDVTVHRGERILTQEENKRYNEGGSIEVVSVENETGWRKLGEKLDSILNAIDKIEEFKVLLDGTKLVGAIKREMNMQLADEYSG